MCPAATVIRLWLSLLEGRDLYLLLHILLFHEDSVVCIATNILFVFSAEVYITPKFKDSNCAQ